VRAGPTRHRPRGRARPHPLRRRTPARVSGRARPAPPRTRGHGRPPWRAG
jgi:hypothetical protein